MDESLIRLVLLFAGGIVAFRLGREIRKGLEQRRPARKPRIPRQ
jgi:hypothetical protein